MGIGTSSFTDMTTHQALRAMAEHLHLRNMSVRSAFLWLDRDHNGYITWEEFFQGVNYMCGASHFKPADSTFLHPLFREIDTDKDGFILMTELEAALSKYRLMETVAKEVLERIATALVRTGYTPADLFNRLDRDRNGVLSRSELDEVLLSLQSDLTLSERDYTFAYLDKGRLGQVNIIEFTDAVKASNAEPLVAIEDKIRELRAVFKNNGYGQYESFRVFDQNNDGFLSTEEWQAAIRSILPKLRDADIDAVFQRFDLNGDGFMSLDEFAAFFQDLVGRAQEHKLGEWPVYQPPPLEAPWEKEILDTIRDVLHPGRTGMTIAEVFRRLDLDHDNTLTAWEFDRLVGAYRPGLSADHLSALFQKVNNSRTGAVSMSEFIARFG